jgi:uncharacterized protein YcfJ
MTFDYRCSLEEAIKEADVEKKSLFFKSINQTSAFLKGLEAEKSYGDLHRMEAYRCYKNLQEALKAMDPKHGDMYEDESIASKTMKGKIVGGAVGAAAGEALAPELTPVSGAAGGAAGAYIGDKITGEDKEDEKSRSVISCMKFLQEAYQSKDLGPEQKSLATELAKALDPFSKEEEDKENAKVEHETGSKSIDAEEEQVKRLKEEFAQETKAILDLASKVKALAGLKV